MPEARTVEVVKRELDEAQNRVRDLTAELHELRMEEAGVRPGDVVEAKGQRVKVTKVRTDSYSTPWIKGVLRRKDGSWGTQERHFFSDWNHLPATPEGGTDG